MNYLLDTCVVSELSRHKAERRGRTWPLMDSLMAVSAIAGHMTLVTRNLAGVQDMGVTLFDPWQPG